MALPAHIEESSGSPANAREPRRTIRLNATGELPSGDHASVNVHNISRTGLLIETDSAMAVGESFAIDLPEAGPTLAHVVWQSENLHGCRFEQPLTNAVLSAAQLRSAVIANEPDEAQTAGGRAGEAFGDRLQRLRKAQGLSLSQVAEALGVSKPTVWAWEHGRARPLADRIDALAQALGTSAQDLVSGADTSELADLLSTSRTKIAQVYGTRPENVRIMIEL